MVPFAEVKEVAQIAKKQIEGKETKAFEKSGIDEKKIIKIPTINEGLVGKRIPGTNVEFKKHSFIINGNKIEGVFPKFESKFDVNLPKDLRQSSDYEQFKFCTNQLKKAVESNPALEKNFNQRQLQQIHDGAPRISGLTWHHSEISGRMQLVDSKTHDMCKHTGGRNIWGGGSGCR